MSNALAVEGRFKVINFLKEWVERGQLSYKFSVHENAFEPTRVRVTFSKPTPESPATAAVAHLYFQLDEGLKNVLGFTVESESHFHSLKDLRFDEAILDHVIRRKMVLKQQHLVRLSDEFSSTRVPVLMQQRRNEKRDHDREGLEEYILERFQRKDPYNDGRISFQECKDVLYSLEFPALSRRDREILLAFVELDRDEMVDYGTLVSIGAEVIDTLLNVPATGANDAKAGAKGDDSSEEDPITAWYQTTVKQHQQSTIDALDKVLDAFRPPPPTPPPASDAPPPVEAAEATPPASDEGSAEVKDTGNNDEAAVSTPTASVELHVSRRQLRTSLESPQLLLSRAEINLLVALAIPTSSGEIPCSQLHELLQHVQQTVFRFQTRCLTDRVEDYVLQQFMSYESSKLEGTAEHLKKRLRQKEIRTVVKDMKKLMLSPLQAARIIALADSEGSDADRIVHCEEYTEQIAEFLREQADLSLLHRRAMAWEELEQVNSLDEELVRQHATEAMDAMDTKQQGTITIADFKASVSSTIRSLGLGIGPAEVSIVAAIADPTGQGKVNAMYALQLMHPVLEYLEREAKVTQYLTGGNAEDKDTKTEK